MSKCKTDANYLNNSIISFSRSVVREQVELTIETEKDELLKERKQGELFNT